MAGVCVCVCVCVYVWGGAIHRSQTPRMIHRETNRAGPGRGRLPTETLGHDRAGRHVSVESGRAGRAFSEKAFEMGIIGDRNIYRVCVRV